MKYTFQVEIEVDDATGDGTALVTSEARELSPIEVTVRRNCAPHGSYDLGSAILNAAHAERYT